MKTKKIYLVLAIVLFLVAIGICSVFLNSKNNNYYTLKTAEGFIYYSDANADDYRVNSANFTYGPYQLNTTENNYLLIKLANGNDYKSIGYIKLYHDSFNEANSFYANWYSDNINFLAIKVKDNDKSHWYFLDENGNLIQLSDTILNSVMDENKQNNIQDNNINEIESNITQNTYENETAESNGSILDNITKNDDQRQITQNSSNIIYKSEKDYGEFNIGITNNNKIIIYKEERDSSDCYEVFAEVESYVSTSKIKDSNYIKNYGPGFYADWNNANAKQIRIRVDKIINGEGKDREGYIWYTFDKNGKQLSKREFINPKQIVYKNEKDYGEFNIGITNNNKIIIYKEERDSSDCYEVFAEVESYVSTSKIKDSNYIKNYGPGFYADWNNANAKQIRIRVDKIINGEGKDREGYIWYTFDNTAKLLNVRYFIS